MATNIDDATRHNSLIEEIFFADIPTADNKLFVFASKCS